MLPTSHFIRGFTLFATTLVLGWFAASTKILLYAQNSTDITATEVRDTIHRAVEFLKLHQEADGTWPERPVYGGGLTPLCTLALLHAGCPVTDGAVTRALDHLEGFEPYSTYTASLQTMVFCVADAEKYRPLIERNVRFLESTQHKSGESAGMWSIPRVGTPEHTDNSMTHMAMLALYEAERFGVPANDETWRLAREYWQRYQNPDGSWGWGPEYPGSGSMTCAGIASLVNSARVLGTADAEVIGDEINCCTIPVADEHVDQAFAWLTRNFTVNRNPGTRFWLSYYLYSLERAGRITSRRFIGDHDRYREGTRMLVNLQSPDGSWPSDLDEEELDDPLVSTSFNLMFLSKGRWPVLLGELKHQPDNDWRHHRNALFNLVNKVEIAWEQPLSYQTVDIATATVEDLMESPVLYMTGKTAPDLSDKDIKKLRQYIDRGGFLFAHPSCDGGEFDSGFRALVKRIFPDSPLRLLSPQHPAWYAEAKLDARFLRELWGVDTSCRTAVFYSQHDLACSWELARSTRVNQYSPEVLGRIDHDVAMAMNILAYCTNREVKFKNPAVPTMTASDEPHTFDRDRVYIANVLHPGGCDAAPGALRQLLQLATEELGIHSNTVQHDVRLTNPDLFKYSLLFMHGRTSFELTSAERKQLRIFLERGGTLLADSVCSSEEFTDSFRREMLLISRNPLLERIPPNDVVFTSKFGGFEIDKVSRRRPHVGDAPTTSQIFRTQPDIEGLMLDGRWAVFFSPYDLSCALESCDPVECAGYTREDAARLALNILLYSLEHE